MEMDRTLKLLFAEQHPPAYKGQTTALSRDQIKAAKYLKRKKIFELFNYLLGHLLCEGPSDPITFLDELLNKCIIFRGGLGEPPLLYTPAHIDALYRAFDPAELGTLSMQQYVKAMVSMGICSFEQNPQVNGDGRVSRDTFCTEAERCLTAQLVEMLQVREPHRTPASSFGCFTPCNSLASPGEYPHTPTTPSVRYSARSSYIAETADAATSISDTTITLSAGR